MKQSNYVRTMIDLQNYQIFKNTFERIKCLNDNIYRISFF